MSINWFPGHMNKARRVIRERAQKSDLVIEVLDARVPVSSQNPMLAELAQGLPRLRLLTKPDLADPRVTAQWLSELASKSVLTLEIVTTELRSSKQIVQHCRRLVPSRGHAGFPVRAMIVGIPNVGKSTLFNALAGQKKAVVRDQPAVTRREQRLELPGGLSLIDTPGVLWPKLDDQVGAHRLAASGAIRDAAINTSQVARFLLQFLRERYSHELRTRFKLSSLSGDVDELLERIGRKRGCLAAGGIVDHEKACNVLLTELRSGRIGRVSLERPSDFQTVIEQPGVSEQSGTSPKQVTDAD